MDRINTSLRTFDWQAEINGSATQGSIQATDIYVARAMLNRQGIEPLRLRPQALQKHRHRPVKNTDITQLIRQIANLLKTGISLSQGLKLMSGIQTNPTIKAILDDIANRINAGQSLASSFKAYPQFFDALLISLVEVGEQSGTLTNILPQLASNREQSHDMKQNIRKSLTYPCIVMVVALAVTLLMMVKVIPTFAETFQRFDAELPTLTLIVFNLSTWLTDNLIAMLSLTTVLSAAFWFWYRFASNAKYQIDSLLLSLPYFGNLLTMSLAGQFTRTLATTFAAGVPLDSALNNIAPTLNNLVYRQCILLIREQVINGQKLHQCMSNSGRFPTFAIQLIALGEESGTLIDNLERTASHYESATRERSQQLLELLEPCLMIGLGLVIGGLIIAIYLPMFQLGSVM